MYVYILRSKQDHCFYVGSANDVEKRVNQHNKGYSKSTTLKRPWELVRVEKFENSLLALKREKFLKTGKGRLVLKNICSLE
ncbi:MAG: GIY-YIG nuclease family protein [Candidatus Omnitrophica bacterium]|nr:GIY-YIG nuclease family protein [Candidatus Omnitrophota bacterium]